MNDGVEIKGLEKLMADLERAADGELLQEYGLWLEAMGYEFLAIVQEEIIRTGTVDTRRLLNSFDKGDGEGIWKATEGGLTLEVGTNVQYASYANDGHWTTKEGVEQRFVPGRWKGDRFEYVPGAEEGMVLKRKWVEGTQYWDAALLIFERMFESALEKKLQLWLDGLGDKR